MLLDKLLPDSVMASSRSEENVVLNNFQHKRCISVGIPSWFYLGIIDNYFVLWQMLCHFLLFCLDRCYYQGICGGICSTWSRRCSTCLKRQPNWSRIIWQVGHIVHVLKYLKVAFKFIMSNYCQWSGSVVSYIG